MRRSAPVTTLLFALLVAFVAFVGCSSGPGIVAPSPAPPASLAPAPPTHASCEAASTERARVPALLAEGRLDRTARVIARADTLCAKSAPETWGALVTVLAELGKPEEALRIADMIDASPASSDASRAAARDARQTLAALEKKPGDGAAKEAMEKVYRAAEQSLEKKQYAEAKKGFLDAWSLSRPNGKALFAAGLCAKKMGDGAGAQRLFDRAVAELERSSGKNVAIAVPLGFPGGVDVLALNNDGRMLAIGVGSVVSIRDQRLHLREIMRLEGHAGTVTQLAFSPDGKTLASGAMDDTVRLWNVATGTETRKLAAGQGMTASVSNLVFSPDGKTLTAALTQVVVKLWDVATGASKGERHVIPGDIVEYGPLWIHAISPDGKTAVTGRKTMGLWNVATTTKKRDLAGHTDEPISAAFSGDGKTLASTAGDGTVRLWNVANGAEIGKIEGATPVRGIAFSGDGKTLASSAGDGTVRLWSATKGAELRKLTGRKGLPHGVAFSPDSTTLASIDGWGESGYEASLWSLATGAELRKLGGLTVHPEAVAFVPDGKTVALATRHDVVLWDVTTGAMTRQLHRVQATGSSFAFSPNGKVLALASDSKNVELWEIATGAKLSELRGHTGEIPVVAYSPDGKTLASGSHDRTLRLWRVFTGAETRKLEGHTKSVEFLAFAPDGQSLASASSDGTVRVWSVATGAELRKLERVSVKSVALSAHALAWSSEDGAVRLSPSGGERVIALRALSTRNAGYALTDGAVELVGPDAEAAVEHLGCRVGALSFPFELCRERHEVRGLLATALAGGAPSKDP
jgi:WD40 repeat protein